MEKGFMGEVVWGLKERQGLERRKKGPKFKPRLPSHLLCVLRQVIQPL